MLTIWIGRAGSGKSRRVLDEIKNRRGERQQVLLVPDHVSHEAEVDLCRSCGETASRDAEILTFRTLAGRVLSECGGLADFTLDNGGKLLTMRLILQELHSQLKVFGRPSRRAGFLEQLTDLADEFYAFAVSPEQIWEQVKELEGASGDKLRDLAMIYAAYDGRLRSGGIDRRSRVQKLRDRMDSSHYLDGKDVYFDGFSYFNRAEEDVIEKILGRAESVTVTLLGEKGNDELFYNAVRERDRLVRMAARAGVPCRVLYLTGSPAGPLGHLEKHLFGTGKVWEGDAECIQVYQASTAFAEVEYVASKIRQLACGGTYRYREIGVMARNMDVYGPILENVFQRDGIPAYISRRSDILEKPVLTMLLGALDAVTGGFDYEDVFRCLKTGMAGITPEECDILENYAVTWEIRGNAWIKDEQWSRNPDGYGQEMTEERAARLEAVNQVRRKVRERFAFLKEGLSTMSGAAGKAKVLYEYACLSGVPETMKRKADELLESGQVQLAEEYAQLWGILCGVLDQFVEILGDSELGAEEFARLLRLVLTEYSVGTIPATLDQVKVSDITRNDRHPVKCLFLLGANDHVLPQVETGSGILDERDREYLQQRKILLSDATFDRLDNEMQNIYAALAQPTEQLWVSYPVTDMTGAELRPSFVVDRIRKLFPSLPLCRENQEYRFELPSTALEAAGRDPGGKLWEYFAARGDCDDVLAAMKRARSLGRGALSPEAVQALYGRSVYMSASRIDRLRKCHFSYFMEYGLRAKERKNAGFEAPEIGTFIHYLLENVTLEAQKKGGFANVSREELRNSVSRWIDIYLQQEIPDFESRSARFRYLFSRLRYHAFAVAEDVADELTQSEFQPLECELGFGGKDGRIPAVTIRQKEGDLSLTGKVDRVDGWVRGGRLYLRVVDYKTGKKSFSMSDLQAGLGMQMLLYLFTLQKEGSPYFGMPVEPAGVMYLPARDEIIAADRDVGPEALQQLRQAAVKRSGLILDDPEVMRAMDRGAPDSARYLPIVVSKRGGIPEGLASAAQMGKLSRYVDNVLVQINREIHQGNIDADPWTEGGPRESACTYCPFVSACYFDEGRDRRRYRKKTDAEEFWKYVERQTGKEGKNG